MVASTFVPTYCDTSDRSCVCIIFLHLPPTMVEESLELIRSRNIQRNKDLLEKLDINDLFKSSPPPPSKLGRPRSTGQKPKISKPVPVRRSRRLANTPELEREVKKEEEAAEKVRLEEEARREKRSRRLSGCYPLADLAADIRSGHLKFEERVFKRDVDMTEPINVDGMDAEVTSKSITRLATDIDENPHYNFSKREQANASKLSRTKGEFQDLKIFSDPSKLKLTLLRITALNFHLSLNHRLVVAGDTTGNIGLWSVDQTSDEGENEPFIVSLKPHGKTLSRICEVHHSPSQIVTASYDGSVRISDLTKQESIDALSLNDHEGWPLGISDAIVPFNLPQHILITTLDGHFYQHDTRESSKNINYKNLLRLHDKKIGGFAANPNNSFQIASASLDRSLRLWDLRNLSKKNLLSEIDDRATSPHFYGGYSSRLSISVVEWNTENRLVCNGYDDTINVFDLNGGSKKTSINEWTKTFSLGGRKTKRDNISYVLKRDKTIRHNCQTGRWVSILKARWQNCPQDNIQKFVIGNMNRSFDIYDQHGSIIAQLTDHEKMTAVPAVVSFHPTHNWIVGGTSSGKVYLYT